MSEFKVTTKQLENTKQQVNREITKYTQAKEKLQSTLSKIEKAWEGSAEQEFVKQYQKMQKSLNQYETIIKKYETALQTIKEGYEKTENAARTKISSVKF